MPGEYIHVTDALLMMADDQQREAFLDELGAPSMLDAHGNESRVTLIQDKLRELLMEKLRSGEWIASGFGYESGQPTELHPRLWQRLIINVPQNSAHDSFAGTGRPSLTGSFHSLGFREATSSVSSAGHGERARTIDRLKSIMGALDETLPFSLPKSEFFKHVQEAIEITVKPAWLSEAWRKAKLSPSRRQPGLKSKQSHNQSLD